MSPIVSVEDKTKITGLGENLAELVEDFDRSIRVETLQTVKKSGE